MRGLNAKDASKALGVGVEMARRHYSDPDFQREVMNRVNGAFDGVDQRYGEEKEGMHERLAKAAERSFDILSDMLEKDETTDSMKARIAMNFMDRNPETQAGHTVRSGELSPETLSRAAKTARDMDNVVEMKKKVG